jgi:hypothetical protein
MFWTRPMHTGRVEFTKLTLALGKAWICKWRSVAVFALIYSRWCDWRPTVAVRSTCVSPTSTLQTLNGSKLKCRPSTRLRAQTWSSATAAQSATWHNVLVGAGDSTLRPACPRERDPHAPPGVLKVPTIQCSHISKEHCCFEGSQTSLLVFILRATCRWRWIWSIGEVVLIGENRSTGRETCHSTTFYTTKTTRTNLVLNPCRRGERPTIKY